jgi:CHAT domain-containing protein
MSIIPFEALLTSGVKDVDELPYLIRKHNVLYDFAASLLLQHLNEKKNISTPSILLCAPVSFSTKDNLNELPGTESEVREIGELFTRKNYKSSTYLRQQADEKLVKSTAVKDYKYLHFATHGIVDEANPDLSRIFLQPDNNEDGNLFAGEIYDLQLNAELVTLSACQTGLGKIAKGEGVIGLSRALVYAGAQNIMVSFWSVSDASTALLMKTFYQQLLDNPTAGLSENLQQAKLHLINSESYSSPFFWAPFVLIGTD